MAVPKGTKTVDEIVDQVEAILRSEPGEAKVAQLNGLVKHAVHNVDAIHELKGRLYQRPGMQLYINASTAKDVAGRAPLSVRVHGVECGTVRVTADGKRAFTAENRRLFGTCGFDDADEQEWSSSLVTKYIRAAAAHVKVRPEARVESELIWKMKGSGEEWREQQPVCLAELPFQVPLPISASGTEPKLGRGHIDVLARLGRGGKGLRIYEVKAPKADASRALDQAVAYMAALKFMLDQPVASDSWWKLIGFKRPPSRRTTFEAFAFVADTPKNRKVMAAAKARLGSGNRSGIAPDARFYPQATGTHRL